MERRRRIDQALLAVVMEAHPHGVLTRKVDDLVRALDADTGISKSEVSRMGAAVTCCHSELMSKERFAHDALLSMQPGADDRAPGGVITVALCGSWEHEPPCPLAPHHTRAERAGDEVRLRVLFAAEPDEEPRVRATIDVALARGTGAAPEGGTVSWRLVGTWASEVRPEEQEHAGRLARS